MKFVKQHSWEQEWAETLRKEKAYLQKNLRKKDSALNRTLEEHIPDTLQDTLDAAFAKAFALIFEKGTGVIERTYNKNVRPRCFRPIAPPFGSRGTGAPCAPRRRTPACPPGKIWPFRVWRASGWDCWASGCPIFLCSPP